ncbi:hypothetical protein Anas_02277 [Armadillidium nasatum]|uniref:Uncharacterized protein n=1 Tax=Armadillidium nasatum TaxID=96803 RepID=A0A5N5TDR5_9CRUS|nr:hypothetical protein Anas_02277 [Armadillidium nasatum]
MSFFTIGKQDYEMAMKGYLDSDIKLGAFAAVSVIFLLFFVIVVVIACSTGGLDLLVTLLSPAWTEAQESLIIQNGLESIPSKVKLGLQAGLNIISIQMECPMSNKPRHQLFEKKLTLGNREMLHKQYLYGSPKWLGLAFTLHGFQFRW